MKNVSKQFLGSFWKDWRETRSGVPVSLRRVAATFNDLQDQRHAADYDNSKHWEADEVRRLLDLAQSAFNDWYAIRDEPIAGNYLLAMLLKKR